MLRLLLGSRPFSVLDVKLISGIFLSLLLVLPIHAQRIPIKPAPEKKAEETKKNAPAESVEPTEPVKKINVRWFGHSFVYLTTPTGVRIAIDPYAETPITYPFPDRLNADVVLISNESDAHSAGERIFGSPLVFRSVACLGINRASGFIFKGIQTYKDQEKGRKSGGNTVFTFTIDGVKFAHLGVIGHPLNSRLKEEIGNVDVLFLPVGLPSLPVEEWRRIAQELNARVIVPTTYQSNFSAQLTLRPLDDFLQGQTNVVKITSDQFDISARELPVRPAIYVLKYP